jgi:hypothetical protein
MRTDKLTSKFQMALQEAQSFALGRDHQNSELKVVLSFAVFMTLLPFE